MKYIDKEVLLERMNRTRPYEGEDGSFERYRRLQWLADIGQVNMCPAADVAEVRHGQWILNDNGTYSCSLCQSWIPEEQHHYARHCLYCGAKMDEVEDNG